MLIAVLAVGDDGAQLTLAREHLDNGVLDILDVEDACLGQELLLAELKHLVGILLCRSLNVALVADGASGPLVWLSLSSPNRTVRPCRHAFLPVSFPVVIVINLFSNLVCFGKLLQLLEEESFPFWSTFGLFRSAKFSVFVVFRLQN